MILFHPHKSGSFVGFGITVACVVFYFFTRVDIVQISEQHYFEHHARMVGGGAATFAGINNSRNVKIIYDLIDKSGRRIRWSQRLKLHRKQAALSLTVFFEAFLAYLFL
jgi:hypothetical protein